MKVSTALVSLVLLFIASILSGCATQGTAVSSVRQRAEVDMSKFERIAVGDFYGRGGVDIGEDLTAALTSSNQFKVIDRSKVKSLLREGRLATTGLMNQETAVELGKLLGVAAYVDGRVSIYDQQEETDNYSLKDSRYRLDTRTGKVTVEVAFNVVDLETGQVLLNKKILKRTSATTTDLISRNTSRIDYVPLYLEARQKVIQEFMHAIAPYKQVGNHKRVEKAAVTNSLNADSPLNLAWVQKKLNDLGFECGDVDGFMGPNTRACIRAFQTVQGLNATGSLNNATITALLEGG